VSEVNWFSEMDLEADVHRSQFDFGDTTLDRDRALSFGIFFQLEILREQILPVESWAIVSGSSADAELSLHTIVERL
jgi:hypothetical protein